MKELPWQYDELSQIVLDRFNYKFRDQNLLIQAMSHSSYIYERKLESTLNNERLEFLGDSVLSLYFSETLYEKMSADEGILSQIRSSLENEERFAEFSEFIDLTSFLLLGKGEEKNNGRQRRKNLCRLFEAFAGAMFVDSDYQTIKKNLDYFFNQYQEELQINLFSKDSLKSFDSKSDLQELFMKKFKTIPRYKLTKMSELEFKAELFLFDKRIDFGFGQSKKEAEKNVAAKVLKNRAKLKG